MSALGPCNFARNSIKALFLLLLAVITALPALGSDTQPPVLTSFTFSPMAVNTTTSSANVTVTAQFTDDLSGVNYGVVFLTSPSGNQSHAATLIFSSGTVLDGTFVGTATFPAFGEPGTWTVSYLYVYDFVYNQRSY